MGGNTRFISSVEHDNSRVGAGTSEKYCDEHKN